MAEVPPGRDSPLISATTTLRQLEDRQMLSADHSSEVLAERGRARPMAA
jgi:hypothetical protein